MTKRMLADVLWDAANVHLHTKEEFGGFFINPRRSRYSCDAICYAADNATMSARIKEFIQSLGCDTDELDLLQEFGPGMSRQGVRYMWLLLAMRVAEDEGVTL